MKIARLIQNLVPYVAGKPIEETKREFGLKSVIKLASNENPLGPSLKAIGAIQLALSELHRYPDPSCLDLKTRMSAHLKVPAEMLAFGNGSDEMIDLMLRVFCSEGGRALLFENSFAAYKIAAHANNVETDEVKLRPQFQMSLDDLHAAFRAADHRLIFIVNPNNPTGVHLKSVDIKNFLKKIGPSTDTLVILDEAYFEFVKNYESHDSLQFIKDYPNLVVLRTMSKAYGLAGIRVGTMIAHSPIIDLINRSRKPFNVNSLAQVAAVAALDDQAHVQKVVQLTHEGLAYFETELKKLALPFIASAANFVMFETKWDSNVIFLALLKRGIILRPLKNYGLKNHLRLSVGTRAENQAAIRALTEVLRDLETPPVIEP